jgi:HKD family nuclease
LQVPGLIWDVPGISISTAYERPTIVDTIQAPHQNTYYTNLTFTDPSEDLQPRIIAALQHAVDICGGRPETF